MKSVSINPTPEEIPNLILSPEPETEEETKPTTPDYDPYEYEKGDLVELIDLPNRPQLEGHVGKVQGPFKFEKER